MILTAATGGIRADLRAGDLVVLSDHLNLLGVNPLRGLNDERLGTRFPDMTEVYSPRLRKIVAEEAERLTIDLSEGVYACMPGPSYETPAEIRMLRTLGADLVGMSTVPEAIVATRGPGGDGDRPGLQRRRRRAGHADHARGSSPGRPPGPRQSGRTDRAVVARLAK